MKDSASFILSAQSLYGWPCEAVFKLAKRAGFDGLEIVVTPDKRTQDAAYLNRLREEYGLPVYSVHSPLRGFLPGWKMDAVERVKRSVLLAQKVNAGIVVAHPPARFAVPSVKNLLNGSLFYRLPANQNRYSLWLVDGMAKFLQSTPVTIAIENMPPERVAGFTFYPYEYHDARQMKRFGAVTLDVTHIGACGRGLLETYGELKGAVVHIHLSNYNGKEHTLLDNGRLPIKEFLGLLKRDGYRGGIVLEFLPEEAEAFDAGTACGNLERNLAFCRENFV